MIILSRTPYTPAALYRDGDVAVVGGGDNRTRTPQKPRGAVKLPWYIVPFREADILAEPYVLLV